MIRKRVKAGFLSAALAVSVLLVGVTAISALAETVNMGNNVGREFSISGNDLSITENPVGVAELVCTDQWMWRVPSNPYYYVNYLELYDSTNGEFRDLSDAEWDAFKSAVLAGDSNYTPNSIPNVSDETLSWVTAAGITIGSSGYLASELIVVDSNSTTILPKYLDRKCEDGSKDSTYYDLAARNSNGEWVELFEYDSEQEDITFSWSDYLKDDYVYYSLISGRGSAGVECDANTCVYRFFTTSDKLDAMRQMTEWTISEISDGSEGMVDNGNGTYTVKDNELGSTVINAAVVSEGMVYRMYNPNSGEHFYTKDPSEKDSLVASGWNYEEDASFETIAATEEDAVPVYRVYNPNSGLHHYTMDKGEALSLKGLGWNYEGISLYVYNKNS